MASPKSLSAKVLLTTAACLALAACGGGSDRSGTGVYRGEGASERTVPSAAHGLATSQSGQLHARLSKLENDVAGLRNDFSQLAMTYNGLMTTNERIDSLLTTMEERQRAEDAAAARKAEKPAAAKAQARPVAKPAVKAPAAKGPAVTGVRLGEHGDKTRLVIDGAALGKVQTDLDNTEKLLIVTIPKAAWEAKTNVSGLGSPLVSGWTVQDSGGAKTLAVQLKKPVKIIGTENIRGDADSAERFVIDLGAAS